MERTSAEARIYLNRDFHGFSSPQIHVYWGLHALRTWDNLKETWVLRMAGRLSRYGYEWTDGWTYGAGSRWAGESCNTVCLNFANILWHLLECLKTKITIILINLKWKPSSLPWSLVPWHLRLLGVRSRMTFTEGTLHESEGRLSPSLVGPYSGYSYFKNEAVMRLSLVSSWIQHVGSVKSV